MANRVVTQTSKWRLIGWGLAAALLAAPFVAMQFPREMNWSLGDFIFVAVLLAIVGGLMELAAGMSRNWAYRTGFALAVLGSVMVIWVNGAVGIVGSEDRPENLWFLAALLVAVGGALLARLRPAGMAVAMAATAAALWAAFAAAVGTPTDEPHVPHLREFVGLSLFALLFVGSAALFRRAAQDQSSS